MKRGNRARRTTEQEKPSKANAKRAQDALQRKEEAAAVDSLSPELAGHVTSRPVRQAAVLQMQRTHGNRQVQRMLAGHAIQREDGDEPAGKETPKTTEKTVPVPAEHREKVDKATGGGEPAKEGGDKKPAGEKKAEKPPPVPEEAKVRAPVNFDFNLLPPELKIKFLEDFQFTATVTAARLAWHHERYKLGLGYEYGGPLSLTGSVATGAGKFSGSAAFDPSSTTGTFGLGWGYDRWKASLGATTGGKFSAGFNYGATLPPMYTDLSSSIYGAESGGRGLMGAVPGVLGDPASLPGVISAHGEDIKAVGKGAKALGKVADLTKRDPKKIDWGFYIKATAAPGGGLGVATGAGIMFKLDPDAPLSAEMHRVALTKVLEPPRSRQAPARIQPGLRSGSVAPSVIQRALSDADYLALAAQLHGAMDRIGTDEEAIYVALQKLKKKAAAINKLKQVYKDTYKKDLEAHIRDEMSGEELNLALDLINVKSDPKKAALVGSAPGTTDEYKTAARKLHAAMDQVGTDEEAIYAVLIPFGRDATKLDKLKDTYEKEHSGGLTGKGLEADLKDEMSSDELAYALYLLNAPPPATTHTEATEKAAGTEAHKGKVGGGEVTAHTGVQYEPSAGGSLRPEGFKMGYKGPLAKESRWLQFIWREIVVTHPTKGTYRVNQSITTTGGSYNLTTDPSKPNYNTDSNDPKSPFYEAGFFSNRTADAATIYDHPGSMNSIVQSELSGGATKVVSRAHFNSYLIRDYKTLYHVYLQVEWPYTSTTVPARVQTVKSAGKVNALPADMKKRLVEQYPKFAYIE